MSLPVPNGRHARSLHAARTERLLRAPAVPPQIVDKALPEIAADPELAAAWRDCTLHWLATCPSYREEIRQRVSEAAKRAEKLSRKFDQQYEPVDYLGREVEGCG